MKTNTAETVETSLQIGWDLPLWAVFVVALIFIVFAGWIYWRERGSSSSGMRICLAAIRCGLLLLVLWMIMGWKWQRTLVENPELVIAVDVSESMMTPESGQSVSESSPSVTRQEQVQRLLALPPNQLKQLAQRYRLKFYFVAHEASSAELSWQDLSAIPWEEIQASNFQIDQSRLGDALIRIVERQAGRTAAAIIFFSDGIVTSGRSLEQAGQRAQLSSIPVHAVAVGRELAQPDLRVSNLLAEDQVFFGDRVSMEAAISATDIRDSSVSVQLKDLATGKILDTQRVNLSVKEPQGSVQLNFVPDRAGEMTLEVAVQELPSEINTINNRAQWKLNVLDREIRVMLAFDHPSYEFRYLKHFLERSAQQVISVTSPFSLTSILRSSDLDYVTQDITAVRFIPTTPEQLTEYDVFILGPVDPSLIPPSTQSALVRAVTHGGAGCIFLISDSKGWKRLVESNLGVLLPVESVAADEQNGRGYSVAVTRMGEAILPFDGKSRSSDQQLIREALPPLYSVLPIGSVKSGAQTLAEAISIADGSSRPLLISQFAGAGRSAALATDETYRWTSVYGSDVHHQQFWGQLLRWLSRGRLKGDGGSELIADPKQAKAGSTIQLRLVLAPNLTDQDVVQVKISGPEGMERAVTLHRVLGSPSNYQASLEPPAAGSYRASLISPALPNPPAADFSVVAPQSEQANLKVDVDAMKLLAEISQGRFWAAEEAAQWYDHVPVGRPVQLGILPAEPLWNRHWVALLFIGLIIAEWLLRRSARML